MNYLRPRYKLVQIQYIHRQRQKDTPTLRQPYVVHAYHSLVILVNRRKQPGPLRKSVKTSNMIYDMNKLTKKKIVNMEKNGREKSVERVRT